MTIERTPRTPFPRPTDFRSTTNEAERITSHGLGAVTQFADIRVAIDDGQATVTPIGELDLATFDTLAVVLERVWEQRPHQIVIDLAQTDFIDCSTIGLLERQGGGGRPVVLVNAHGIVKRLLNLVHEDSRGDRRHARQRDCTRRQP